ncbi:restriction endonuclease subunit S [Streptococcus mutans]|nr:restriction endonuclease subunit S [Streptococcus mutans]
MTKTPKLRFPGFTDAWEQRKLGEVAEIKRGLTYKPSDVSESGVRVLRSSNIDEDRFVISVGDVFVKKTAINIIPMKDGDILVTAANGSSRLVGKHAIVQSISNEITVHGGFMLAITYHNPYFLNASMSSHWYSKFIKLFVSGGNGAIGNLSKYDLEEQKVHFPTLPEQEAIGTFFRQLDELLTLHQRKLDEVKNLKKSLLQKMFPKNGERIPEVRFPEFTDAWEQRKLGEVVEITMGQSPSSKNYTENPSDYILVQGNADMKNGHVVPRVWTTQITKQAEKGDLILSVRAPVGDIGKTDYDVVIGRGVAAIKGNSFIFQLLTKMKITGYWTRFSTGSTFESINSDNLKNAQIIIPSLKEQEKIGKTFNSINSLISLHQRKLEHLQSLKRALLQQMFI